MRRSVLQSFNFIILIFGTTTTCVLIQRFKTISKARPPLPPKPIVECRESVLEDPPPPPPEEKETEKALEAPISTAFYGNTCFSEGIPLKQNGCYLWPKRIDLSHMTGGNHGVPFATNYSTLGVVFASNYCPGSIFPMLDLRIHRFDTTAYAFNAGLIGRYVPNPSAILSSFCNVLGLNAYYDYREGGIGYYQQLGGGIEVIGCNWDLRGNVYYPIGPKKRVKVCVFDDYVGDYVITNHKYESVSFSFNAEVGYYFINSCSFLFYGAAGPYFIAGRKCHDNTVGGKARVRPQYKDYVALDLSLSYDPLFQKIWQVEVIFSLPLYQMSYSKNPRGPCGISNRQIYQPVERFEIMPLSQRDCWNVNY